MGKMTFFRTLFLSLFGLFLCMAQAQAYHGDLDRLLEKYVSPSQKNGIDYLGVNYDAWAKDPSYKTVVDRILATHPDSLGSEEAKKAFWLNAYNVLTVDMVIRTEERENIQNQGDRLKSPFSTYKWNIGGIDYTLDQIKNDILIPMGDPRMLFAMNSGSISCPDIRREAYRAARLEGQLRDQVVITLKNQTKGLKFEGNVVRVPQYLDWYKKIFKDKGIKGWLKGYYPDHIDGDTEVGFFQYDWSLNKARPRHGE